MAKKEIEVSEQKQYLAVIENQQVSNVIDENFGENGIRLTDLQRIKMPTGGGVSWTVLGEKGVHSVDSITGIILYHKEIRAYWTDPNSLGEPPACKSEDTVHGFGHPGGMCYVCPKAQFGSSLKGGAGQACKLMRIIYLLPPDALLPIVIQLPPTSLKPFRAYLMQLTTHMLTYKQVETSFSLSQVTPKGSPTYSVVNVEMVRKLDEIETPNIAKYANTFQELVDKQGIPIMEDSDFADRKIDDLKEVDASELLDIPVETIRTTQA
jgi:hypothetical protein